MNFWQKIVKWWTQPQDKELNRRIRQELNKKYDR